MPQGHAPFALVNRTVNPLLGVLLRSPAHRLLSGRLALITVTGRSSGRRYTFPVDHRRDGDTVEVTVGWPARKKWWRNLRGEGGPVEMLLQGKVRTGHALARGNERDGVSVEIRLDPGGSGGGS